MNRLAMLALLFVSSAAVAVPSTVQHQGRLFDANGDPLTGSDTVTFALYDTQTGGTEFWSEAITVSFDEGYFSVSLGQTTPLDSSLLDGADSWLQTTVGTDVLPDRNRIHSVPYAVRASAADSALTADSATTATNADTATNLSGGTVDASEILINGTTVIDSSGAISGTLPAHQHDGVDISSGTISVDRLPVGGSATDVAAGDHAHGFGQITGVVDITQLPVGGSASDVSAGDHSHAFGQLTGVATVSQLPVGTTAAHVAAGDHSHTAADVGAVAVGDPLQPGDSTAVCDGSDAAEYGTIRFTGDSLEVCTPEPGWVDLWRMVDGTTPATAGASCLDLLNRGTTADGIYWLNPTGAQAYEVYCDQTTDGGGWTAVLRLSNFDAGIDFTHDGAGWSDTAPYNDIRDVDLNDLTGTTDHRSQAYTEVSGDNVLVRESLQTDLHAVRTADGVLAGRQLWDITSPAIPGSGGAACSSTIVYLGSTPVGGSTLTFATDEGPDTEPGKIAIRASCAGDSSALQLGYNRSGHGDNEVYSQGNQWTGLASAWVFVR